MAAIPTESNAMSNYPKDLLFDLDEVLTLPEESGRQIAAPRSLLMNMPTVATSDVCSVCIESFGSTGEDGIGKQVPCGHVFHETCITSWFSHHDSCPLCRCQFSDE
ncbi:hypothetical protein I3843_04G147100 [Carya illinoinensis]|uniref:RING-type domain-containing protein n=1 Tax=Carya illinoinensis TaxID=32201 RepID=A0A8T1QWV9_CARIL|nr:hypothetical protein I3760_04G155600 [Carya illinoinensis]KAG6658401.1 hypothetical protein CIPAW_04G158500 [Carya illinoinensis]KAG6718559.1 hypothetical protein I3842_04G157400 [Carya illinoinensis]KAG7984206.1 hypothetical protein I3843_04G147100 [Carya illinoinensis]